eukprot:TRINITY_DN2919_c0_g1_i2.p1 TRINITY_DN2919_c0_g1~~TRINITY_DN2919_c0_g1_i2.p1  ORF type:complete len:1011 (+),score=226.32 TRINITY_DN2919_c0_g1_i2:108-3140(+)
MNVHVWSCRLCGARLAAEDHVGSVKKCQMRVHMIRQHKDRVAGGCDCAQGCKRCVPDALLDAEQPLPPEPAFPESMAHSEGKLRKQACAKAAQKENRVPKAKSSRKRPLDVVLEPPDVDLEPPVTLKKSTSKKPLDVVLEPLETSEQDSSKCQRPDVVLQPQDSSQRSSSKRPLDVVLEPAEALEKASSKHHCDVVLEPPETLEEGAGKCQLDVVLEPPDVDLEPPVTLKKSTSKKQLDVVLEPLETNEQDSSKCQRPDVVLQPQDSSQRSSSERPLGVVLEPPDMVLEPQEASERSSSKRQLDAILGPPDVLEPQDTSEKSSRLRRSDVLVPEPQEAGDVENEDFWAELGEPEERCRGDDEAPGCAAPALPAMPEQSKSGVQKKVTSKTRCAQSDSTPKKQHPKSAAKEKKPPKKQPSKNSGKEPKRAPKEMKPRTLPQARAKETAAKPPSAAENRAYRGEQANFSLRSACGHVAQVIQIESFDAMNGKFQVCMSGPLVQQQKKEAKQILVKRLCCEPDESSAVTLMAKFLGIKAESVSVIASTAIPGTRTRLYRGLYRHLHASGLGVRLKVNGVEIGIVGQSAIAQNSVTSTLTADALAREPKPTKEQQAAIDLVCSTRKTCFITGEAGTGKSLTLRHIEYRLKKMCTPGSVHVTASTGIAAERIGGSTVYAFAGIGRGDAPCEMLIKRVLASNQAVQRWCCAECLVIDEVSMLSAELFDVLDKVARAARRRPEVPFGGLQLVLCGDFFQLGPHKLQGYAFEATAWDEVVQHHFCLKEVKRQEHDDSFRDILSELRVGQITPEAKVKLSRCMRPLPVENGVLPTKLHCTNRDVDVENARELSKLEGPTHIVESAAKNSSIPEEVELKVGAQVVLTYNLDDKLVNGSRGVVKEFSANGLPVVEFNNGMQKEIRPVKMNFGHDSKIFREQLPLKLAWALTVHRCQGMTLDKAECSIADAFAPGQAYVALSRVSSMAGLQMHGFDFSRVIACPKVQAFYASSRFATEQTSI